jgi:hypothetical protein
MLDGHDDVSTKVNKVSRGNSQSTRAFADTVTRGVDGKHYKKRVIRVKIDICHLSLAGSAEIRGNPVQHRHRFVPLIRHRRLLVAVIVQPPTQ